MLRLTSLVKPLVPNNNTRTTLMRKILAAYGKLIRIFNFKEVMFEVSRIKSKSALRNTAYE